MTDDELMERYYLQREKMKHFYLEKFSDNAQKISNTLGKIGLSLKDDNFEYSDPVGLTVKFDNIVSILAPELIRDKDDLIKCKQLAEFYQKKSREGYYYANNYMLMLTPFLRRGMHPANNWAPQFVRKFWESDFNDIEASVTLDYDRVKIDVDEYGYVELDTWFGAPFEEDVSNIKEGISKLRPPMSIDTNIVNIFFNNIYSLDIKWNTKGNIKTFQSLEFSSENVVVEFQGELFHPAKYIHAEFDIESGLFRHFDGAIHFYTQNDYMMRRDSDFNHTFKNRSLVKAKAKKIFKLDGKIPKDLWVEFTCHFFTGNPLIVEYFTGSYPQYVIDGLNRVYVSQTD
ncbi:hypothetical protein AOY79_09280 [Escherichia coli]|uniref:hypothetical protein n=1 Tax=Escherichia coli TaxID=562 RepID=UPI001C5C1372|nr:hypothetical protein [Escherichia coli]MCN2649107.1 hypothetical protein [Escherichia coli]MCN5375408.1 hypothetical protein [Escherichia coli]MDU9014000.1 hypothetical protein [Escherichia coli]UMS35412.1 hypothetical protein AOY79_09280 [Escherichia coli]UMT37497.1 hypothetical protein AOY54_14935 [Escherichia coli]